MGYLAYEAADLLDGHPAPEPGDAPCPPIGLLRDRSRGGLRPLAAATDPGRPRARRAATTTASRAVARPGGRGSRPPRSPAWRPRSRRRASPDAGEANMPDEGYRWTVSRVQGAHPGRRHLPGRPLATGDVRRAGRRVPDLPPAPGDQPRAVHVLRADARAWSSPGSSPEPLVRVEGRRVSSRPIAGTRPRGQTEIRDRLLEHELLADPKEQVRARDAGRPRPQRSRARLRARLGPADGADGGRALLEGDAHRLDGRGRAPRGAASARRAGGDVPGGNGHRRAQAPRDGADRRARADGPRTVRRARSATSRSPATWTSASRSGRRSSPTDGCRCRPAPAWSRTPIPRRELHETKAKAAALLPAVARRATVASTQVEGEPDDPDRRPLRLVHRTTWCSWSRASAGRPRS